MRGKIQNEMFYFMFYLNLPTIIVVPCSKLFLDNSIKQKDFFPMFCTYVLLGSGVVRGVTRVAEATPIFWDLFYILYVNHVVIKISGFLTNYPSGQLSLWPFGLLAIRTSSHPDIWPFGHPAIRTSGYLDFWASEHLAIRTSGHSNVWLSRHLTIRTYGHLAFYPKNVVIDTFLP